MTSPRIRSGAALAAAAAALWMATGAASGADLSKLPKAPGGPQDISGIWFGGALAEDINNLYFKPVGGGDIPFNAVAKAKVAAWTKAEKDGRPVRQPTDECAPFGVPIFAIQPTPMQVIQTPGQVTMIMEGSRSVRVIYLDQEHPKDWQPTFMGHSVGHWEGDTLVVDTVGQLPQTLDFKGAPASDKLHVVERIRKIEGGAKLEDLLTVTDPVYLEKPYTGRRDYYWSPEERVQEYVCEENDRVEPGSEHTVAR